MSDKRHNLLALLESAIGRLQDVLRQPYDEYMRDSAIQRFEFTFELFWKALKAEAEASGLAAHSPRDSLRAAFQLGVIPDRPEWFRMIEDRNLTSHTYNQSTANAIHSRLGQHAGLIRDALARLRARADGN